MVSLLLLVSEYIDSQQSESSDSNFSSDEEISEKAQAPNSKKPSGFLSKLASKI